MNDVRISACVLIGVLALGSARAARFAIEREKPKEAEAEPYAPSPEAAPFVTLGYREAAVDLLWVRFRGYFGGQDSTSRGIGNLVDAIVALDPKFQPVYRYGAHALQLAVHGVDQESHRHAIRLLERGMREFPDDWRLFELASQIYTQDLRTDDPAQRRAWDERGTLLMEAAIRKPGAPRGFATWAATMRTRLGQHERAVKDLRELILITSDVKARGRLIAKLAELEDADAAAIASEIHAERQEFEARWQRERPALPATWYILLGPPRRPGFDLVDLATGGRDLFGSEDIEPVEPLDVPASADAPPAPAPAEPGEAAPAAPASTDARGAAPSAGAPGGIPSADTPEGAPSAAAPGGIPSADAPSSPAPAPPVPAPSGE